MNLRVTLLVVALVVVSFAALALGPVPVDARELWRVVTGGADPVARAIVLDVRAPRVALALLVGAALGMSGGVLQGALRNPLAEPWLLGVSGGAAVGAVLAMSAGLGDPSFLSLAAFAGALAAVFLVLGIARASGLRADPRVLLMAGVVVGAFANAAIMVLLATAPAEAARGALWWMMGSLGSAQWRDVARLGVVLAMPRPVHVLPPLLLAEDETFLLHDLHGLERARVTERAIGGQDVVHLADRPRALFPEDLQNGQFGRGGLFGDGHGGSLTT